MNTPRITGPLLGLLFFCTLSQARAAGSTRATSPSLEQSASPPALRTWLSRPLGLHPELLAHGEISPFVDLGLPFGYRIGLKLGLLDILTVGAIAQWRSRELGMRIAPELGLALYRGRNLAIGLRYRYLFHQSAPQPVSPQEPKVGTSTQGPSSERPKAPAAQGKAPARPEELFFRVNHYAAASLAWSSGYLSAAMEAGLSYRRELDQSQEILDPRLFRMQWRPMTGVSLRFGDPQWGVVLQAMIPSPELSLRFEWRYSLFALKKRRDPLSLALDKAAARQRKAARRRRASSAP